MLRNDNHRNFILFYLILKCFLNWLQCNLFSVSFTNTFWCVFMSVFYVGEPKTNIKSFFYSTFLQLQSLMETLTFHVCTVV